MGSFPYKLIMCAGSNETATIPANFNSFGRLQRANILPFESSDLGVQSHDSDDHRTL